VIGKVRSFTRRNKHRTARRSAPETQSGDAGLVHLFPSWRVLTDVQLPGPFRMVAGGLVAAQTPCWSELGHPQQSLSPELGDRDGNVKMFRPITVAIERYRYRGSKIATPWAARMNSWRAGCMETCSSGSEAGRGNGPAEKPAPRLGPTLLEVEGPDAGTWSTCT